MDEMGVFWRLGPSFKMSAATAQGTSSPLSALYTPRFLLLYLLTFSTFPSIISHFFSAVFSFFLAQLLFSPLRPPAPSLLSYFLYCGIISHFHFISFLACPFLFQPCTDHSISLFSESLLLMTAVSSITR